MTFLDLLGIFLHNAFWAMVVSTGYAIFFNVPRRFLPAILLCAAIGRGLRAVCMEYGGISIEPATLISATVVGFLALFWAQRLHAPATIFAIPSVIPLMPGLYAYRAMVELVSVVTLPTPNPNTLLTEATINIMRTILILGGVGIGIAAPTLLFQRKRPVI